MSMRSMSLQNAIRLAWVRAKASAGVQDGDPVAEHVEENVIRTIAEFEVSRSQSAGPLSAPLAEPEILVPHPGDRLP